MSTSLKPEQFLFLPDAIPVIDVRSPAEYVQGHIPGATNIPLFNNEERAIIGTLYVQKGKQVAIREGMGIAGNKIRDYVRMLESISPDQQLRIHCWRGGMRSESLAWFYEKLGFEVLLLEGGYKTYRSYIRQEFSKPKNLILLGGMTGSGKTALLREISVCGHQTIDLEGMANHKGSAFGHLGQLQQPTTEQFENDLHFVWNRLDSRLPVWVEHESNKIGSVYLPDTFYRSMLQGVLVNIQVHKEIRIQRLVEEYSCHDKLQLRAALIHIRFDMGTTEYKQAIEALDRNDFETVASLALKFYDKAYTHALNKRPPRKRIDITLHSTEMKSNAGMLVDLINNMKD